MTLSLSYLCHSEVGLVRKNNQDSGYASPTMLMVADGMGGAAAGDLASAVAIDALRKADGHYDGEEMLDTLAATLTRANDAIADLVVADHALEGMGTTVCGGMFDGARLGIAHIGDSRGYIVRDGQLMRLTRDHSWVQQLIDEGRITEEEALTHPHRSLILRVLNGQPIIEPEFDLIELQAGDRLLFCSDGLCGLVDDEQIGVALQTPQLDDVMAILVDAALNGGGVDNITIILADVTHDGPALAPVVAGAAATREIPEVPHEPVLLASDDPEDTIIDRSGNRLPRAPMPIDPDASERERYKPVARRGKGRWIRLTLAIVVPILAIIAGLSVWYAYTRNLYYIGSSDNSITIFRGVPDEIAGFQLYSVYETQDTRVADLPPVWAEKVRSNDFPSGTLEDARTTAAELDRYAQECIQIREERARETETPSPSPSRTSSDSAKPSAGSSSPTPASPTTTAPADTEGC